MLFLEILSNSAGRSDDVYRVRLPMIVAPLKASLCCVYPCGVHTNYTRKHKKRGSEPRMFLFGFTQKMEAKFHRPFYLRNNIPVFRNVGIPIHLYQHNLRYKSMVLILVLFQSFYATKQIPDQ